MDLSEEAKKEKIKTLINRILTDKTLSDNGQSQLAYEIELISPDPEIMDYFFWSNMTIDEAIEKAFSYRPICLGDQSNQD